MVKVISEQTRNDSASTAEFSLTLIAEQYAADQPEDTSLPLYQKLYLTVRQLIENGQLAAGSKLPTLQALAQALGLSRGTIAHAYRLLADENLLTLTQGRGTFVAPKPRPEIDEHSRKDQAEVAIEDMLSRLTALNFTRQEIRILLDLKMREYYEEKGGLRVAVFANSLEERHILRREFSSYSTAEFVLYSLEDFLSGRVDPDLYDLYLCSDQVYLDMRMRLNAETEKRLMMVCTDLSYQTALALGSLTRDRRLAVLCLSKNFAQRMQNSCQEFVNIDNSPVTTLLDDGTDDLELVLQENDTVLFPFSCFSYVGRKQREKINNFVQTGGKLLDYKLRLEKTALLGVRYKLEEMADQRKENSYE